MFKADWFRGCLKDVSPVPMPENISQSQTTIVRNGDKITSPSGVFLRRAKFWKELHVNCE